MLGPVGPKHMYRFQRIFVVIASALHIAYGVGTKFNAVDACFSKHSVYRQGYLHLLTTRDGNNKVLPLAWAFCETESADTYRWFAQECYDAGIGNYLNLDAVVYSDRMKGIQAFFETFRAYHAHCFQHIIGNCRQFIAGSGTTFEDKVAWNMRNADTQAEFEVILEQIRVSCPQGAHYFATQVDHARVYQYALNEAGVRTLGFKTSQIVECLNGVFVTARKFTPYRANNKILAWTGKEYHARVKTMQKWIEEGHVLTPWAYLLFQIQVRLGPTYYYCYTLGPTYIIHYTLGPAYIMHNIHWALHILCIIYIYWALHILCIIYIGPNIYYA